MDRLLPEKQTSSVSEVGAFVINSTDLFITMESLFLSEKHFTEIYFDFMECSLHTVKFQNFRTPEDFAVI